MIQPGVSSCIHHNSEFEVCGRKYKMTSKQVWKAYHLLQDDDLRLKAKMLLWKVVAIKVEAKVKEQAIYKTINITLAYGKYLSSLCENTPKWIC